MQQDIHERLSEAEAKARYYQAEYDFLIQQLPNPMFVLDAGSDRILDANEAACELLGYSKDELTTSLRISDIHPQEMALFKTFGEQVYQKGSAETEKLTCTTAAGRCVPVRIHATLWEDHTGHKLIRAIVIENLAKQVVEQALLDEVKARYDYEEIIGNSAALEEMLKQVTLVGPTDAPVLILGETGTGKELICRAIHQASPRHAKPLVKVNCAAVPPGLVESELFGHEKGAFTGAIAQKRGRFELAHGGTIFLDEIGDLPLETQPKLLRVLQEQEFERLGGTRTIKVNTRVIAATHRDLGDMAKEGKFREDLFYRLNVFPVELPPLRERKQDIPLLANYFAHRTSIRYGRARCKVNEAAMELLLSYSWPGNVRELENIVERAVILCRGETIGREHVQVGEDRAIDPEGRIQPLQAAERGHIIAALEATNWKVSGKGGAAELLGLKPTTLEARMKKLGIVRGASQS
jgi:formate hydrogenlyase transcriptional activator